jgi:preprotein translocase subunit YajC
MHQNFLNVLLADVAAPATGGAAGTPGAPVSPLQALMGNPIVFLGLMLVMIYFMLIRPQQQRAKQQAKLLTAIKSGDKVATSSGIIGVIITVKDKSVTLRSADAKFEVSKSSVTEILESGTASES